MIDTLYTIGSSGKALREFVRPAAGGANRPGDRRPAAKHSQLAGFAKREHLEFLLTGLLGIDYRHEPDLRRSRSAAAGVPPEQGLGPIRR